MEWFYLVYCFIGNLYNLASEIVILEMVRSKYKLIGRLLYVYSVDCRQLSKGPRSIDLIDCSRSRSFHDIIMLHLIKTFCLQYNYCYKWF